MFDDDALILPTRDGNSKVEEMDCLKRKGFDPTYKGWKRVPQKFGPITKVRFDPTYKGWKQELKCIGHDFGMAALILPTRDGNSLLSPPSPSDNLALILPTRDGNSRGLASRLWLLLALILPTRDGNPGTKNLEWTFEAEL